MTKKERKAYREGIKVTLASIGFIGLTIAYILYGLWIY